MLETNVSVEVFPRGFPYFARQQCEHTTEDADPGETAERFTGQGHNSNRDNQRSTIAINAGLWLSDPDVDAVTRLSLNPKVRAFRPPSVVLGSNVWTPINTQNTALTREAGVAYYYVRMGYPLKGSKIDRYGDILSGYFVQKCAKHLGQAVRVGTPVADHRRTPHNLFKDLCHELAGMVIVEDLLPWLIDVQLGGGTYADAYASLADHLASEAANFRGFVWDAGGRDFLLETAENMHTWLGAIEQIA